MKPINDNAAARTQKWMTYTGYILSGLPVLLLFMDSAGKLIKPEPVVRGTVELGYNESVIVPLGIVLLICTLLYALPKTAMLGAILLTAYLGGTVATHVRIGNPLFTHTLFGVYIGVLLWLGLYLRDGRLRKLIPIVGRG